MTRQPSDLDLKCAQRWAAIPLDPTHSSPDNDRRHVRKFRVADLDPNRRASGWTLRIGAFDVDLD
jgi:hypothetical protein